MTCGGARSTKKSVWVQMRIPEDIAIASVDGTVDWRILVVVATQVLQPPLESAGPVRSNAFNHCWRLRRTATSAKPATSSGTATTTTAMMAEPVSGMVSALAAESALGEALPPG